ncbi:hypothetical protein BLOT_008555, partial [Blomia tropicalis]
IIIRATLLSFVLNIGVHIVIIGYVWDTEELQRSWKQSIGIYIICLSLFHFGEYYVTAINQPNSVTTEAFLLNHSPEYHFALAISFIEFFIENYFFAEWKFYFPSLIYIGFGMTITGEFIRKVAMLTAGNNFNHIIAGEHDPAHILVTNGIYAIWRHPSYVGWFYWSIGTQIILINPFSFIGYVVVTWRFFQHRIYYEEATLVQFFGVKYLEYKRTVPTGIPFIDGY